MRTGIYAVIDTLANDLVGPVQTHKAEAIAVRFFSDIAAMRNSLIGRHPQDHQLVRLGWLLIDETADGNTPTIEPDYQVILTGANWAAAQRTDDNGAPTGG